MYLNSPREVLPSEWFTEGGLSSAGFYQNMLAKIVLSMCMQGNEENVPCLSTIKVVDAALES
jgi:hypothetical protein